MSEIPVENPTPASTGSRWAPRRAAFVFSAMFCLIVADQLAKMAARATLFHHPPISLLGDIVRLEYAENPGAFLSLGASLPESGRFVVMTLLVGVVLAGALAFALFSRGLGRVALVGLTLVTGGGIGNLIDRIRNAGHVIDFVSMGVGPLRTGIFNVADLAITTGTVLLVLSTLHPRRRHSLASDDPAATDSANTP